jgi:CRISPR/Cas system-associated endonuclease Cas3-HD
VPSAQLNQVLSQIKAMAIEVQREYISGQDVTAEYVDLQSRLKNLEAKEAQLQAIMERATDTEDVLKVYDELSRTREDIEVIKGQMKYYEQAAAMSAISLDLLPNAASRPVEVGGWHPEVVARNSLERVMNYRT